MFVYVLISQLGKPSASICTRVPQVNFVMYEISLTPFPTVSSAG
jgi:hypothetical protein